MANKAHGIAPNWVVVGLGEEKMLSDKEFLEHSPVTQETKPQRPGPAQCLLTDRFWGPKIPTHKRQARLRLINQRELQRSRRASAPRLGEPEALSGFRGKKRIIGSQN